MNCKNCGGSVQQGTTRCVKCGSAIEWPAAPAEAPQQAPPAQQPPPQPASVVHVVQSQPAIPAQQAIAMGPPKSKVAAALLAFFLGSIGIHNFYLGYTGRGLAQLLICVLSCGWGAVVTWPWAFVEFILILTGGIRDRFHRPLT